MIKAPYEISSFNKTPYKSLTNLIDCSRATLEDSLKKNIKNNILITPSVFLRNQPSGNYETLIKNEFLALSRILKYASSTATYLSL